MEGYLGETVINIQENETFKNYTTNDWVLYFIESYGQIDGSHHKQWVLDQVARIIHGTPIIVKQATWSNGHSEYRISLSDEEPIAYKDWVLKMKGSFDGDEYEYDYDEGIAP